MARGHPDFGIELGGLKPILDIGELAARLTKGAGGVNRTGNVLYHSVIQNGLAEFPVKVKGGSNAKILLNSVYADYGPMCVQITCHNVAGNQSYIGKDMPMNYIGKIGLEASILFLTNVSVRAILVLQSTYISGVIHEYKLRINYDSATGKIDLDYLNSGNTFTDFEDIGLLTVGGGFTSFKLVVDNTTQGTPLYNKVAVNGVDHSLAGIAGYKPTAVAATIPVTRTYVYNEALAAAARSIYVGLYTFTVNEL